MNGNAARETMSVVTGNFGPGQISRNTGKYFLALEKLFIIDFFP
jgi:hypothetical protein